MPAGAKGEGGQALGGVVGMGDLAASNARGVREVNCSRAHLVPNGLMALPAKAQDDIALLRRYGCEMKSPDEKPGLPI
jgi:hypothetical protein